MTGPLKRPGLVCLGWMDTPEVGLVSRGIGGGTEIIADGFEGDSRDDIRVSIVHFSEDSATSLVRHCWMSVVNRSGSARSRLNQVLDYGSPKASEKFRSRPEATWTISLRNMTDTQTHNRHSGPRRVMVANHAFCDTDEVYHPTTSPRNRIDRIKERFPNIDVALVQLDQHVEYYNATHFDASIARN